MKVVLGIAASLFGISMLNACTVVTPAPVYHRAYSEAPPYQQAPTYQQAPQSAPIVVDVAPPEPQQEVITVAPNPGYIWIGGAWFWEGGRHIWHPGYWSAPRVGFVWVPHRWERVGVSWHFRAGYWNRHR